MPSTGEAKIKEEFLLPILSSVPVQDTSVPEVPEVFPEVSSKNGSSNDNTSVNDIPPDNNEPVEKKAKISLDPDEKRESRKNRRREKKGQNKHRPGPHKFKNEGKLCPTFYDGPRGGNEDKCSNPNCPFMHNIEEYLKIKGGKQPDPCPNFLTYGKCHQGLGCVFGESHIDEKNFNVVNQELWGQMKTLYESTHGAVVERDVRNQLRKRNYDFKIVDRICSSLGSDHLKKTSGPLTDEDSIALRVEEVKKVDWKDKLYLSPLTTVGNLPFRRICVDYGADITCSEMSLATSLLQGNSHEFALVRRHPSEKIWGVQLCASSGHIAAKAAKVLADVGIDYDFIDLNMGCPLEPIFLQGAGSGLMNRKNKFQTMVKSMTAYMGTLGKPFTVKMRTGIKIDKNFAHTLIPYCRDSGVSMVTLHGRTKDQRYIKFANWDYIKDCNQLADPMPLYGNGDILSYEDYLEKKEMSGVSGIMIGRGALIKPWIFQEIKEKRHIDISAQERLDLIRKYCNYGLDHWGSDSQGLEATRKFLLEWLSFTHRYIPYGLLAEPPQRINQRPPKYVGRDEMETLLSSPNVGDWVKISEMFLGPVPDGFEFLPKHKANSWG